jgi:hypothetical protein
MLTHAEVNPKEELSFLVMPKVYTRQIQNTLNHAEASPQGKTNLRSELKQHVLIHASCRNKTRQVQNILCHAEASP